MSDRVLRVIHVGTGGRGRWPLDVVAGDPRYESVALVDVNDDFLATARELTGLGESVCFDDLAEAARTVEADLIIACTPTATHASFARTAFEAGLSVLVEKGMTLDWQLARDLVAEAEQADVKFCVSQNYRYFPVEQTVKSVLGTEKYGDPSFLDLIHHRHRPNPRTLDYKNAMIWDMSCHHYDNLVFWFGPAKSVIARTFGAPWSRYAPHDANVSAVITFESGVNCTYSMSHVGQNNRHLTWIHTTTGNLRSQDVGGLEFRPANSGETESVEVLDVPRAEQAILTDLHTYITEGAEPGISGRNNLQTLALCEATALSHERDAAVELDDLLT
ncbi:Gfo/Idh/MocA family oxidoreductase [Candidatus Poribacteria bacterium]|jgi:predicted dehydrogenase|nr:Gfo/Idh/MocA family oxidoreductase [Candidatus Poribacteria bacterium]MBT5711649.1 Gfo/Idh/MocA family oxidoreductase [Candidatus Poribacteria bacterium]MBT7098289.1 Gfo/Idh/MocA family oxidoreductase [Candidatus Poribacteria bacterium]MBT7806791.1 Gfo/Idh/MocA family oxidoreductase [Candidatus Poribacteria bacterium]